MIKLRLILKKIPGLKFIYKKLKPVHTRGYDYWIEKYIPNKSIQVIQIGSNDGVSGDSLNKLILKNERWKVLFVEPVPQLFQELKKNYGSSNRFKFENSAINETGASQIFFKIDEKAYVDIPDLSKEYEQIGSFSKAHVHKLASDKLQKYISEIEVNCLSLDELFKKHKITKVDLLQIDAEGYDWQIISQLNLNQFSPIIIVFEHVNLNHQEKEGAINYFSKQYHMFSLGINYLCVRKDKLTNRDFKSLIARMKT